MGHYYDIEINGASCVPAKSWHWTHALTDAISQIGFPGDGMRLNMTCTIFLDGESDMDAYEVTITRKR